MRTMLKSKIHRARVTEVDLNYEGSITIDGLLMEAADIISFEMVHVLNVNNGARFQTYTIEGERGSGVIGLNGAAARLASIGDIVIILCYKDVAEEEALNFRPCLVYVDQDNAIVTTEAGVFI